MVDAPKNSHLRGVHSVAWYYYFLYHNLRLQTLLESSRRRCLIALLDPIVPQSIVFGNLAVFRNTPVAEVSNSSPPWHPKIIPCHFLVISTTISFGSAKAVGTFMESRMFRWRLSGLQESRCLHCWVGSSHISPCNWLLFLSIVSSWPGGSKKILWGIQISD